MHLGTNDVLQKKPSGDIIKAYSTLVDQMRASKSSMRILVSFDHLYLLAIGIARSRGYHHEARC